jgi:hypothetical protein
MGHKQIYSRASDVTAEEGVVNVDGPDAVDVALTPDAAEETSERLLEGSMKARGQKHLDDILKGRSGSNR